MTYSRAPSRPRPVRQTEAPAPTADRTDETPRRGSSGPVGLGLCQPRVLRGESFSRRPREQQRIGTEFVAPVRSGSGRSDRPRGAPCDLRAREHARGRRNGPRLPGAGIICILAVSDRRCHCDPASLSRPSARRGCILTPSGSRPLYACTSSAARPGCCPACCRRHGRREMWMSAPSIRRTAVEHLDPDTSFKDARAVLQAPRGDA